MELLTAIIRFALLAIVVLGGLAVISAVIMNESGMVNMVNDEDAND